MKEKMNVASPGERLKGTLEMLGAAKERLLKANDVEAVVIGLAIPLSESEVKVFGLEGEVGGDTGMSAVDAQYFIGGRSLAMVQAVSGLLTSILGKFDDIPVAKRETLKRIAEELVAVCGREQVVVVGQA